VCDGDWGVAEGLVFDNFKVEDFDWFEEFKRTQEITHGMDFGFSQDPTTVVSTVVDLKNKKLFIYDEHYKKAMLTDDIKQMLIKKGLGDVDIAADYGAGGDRVISELKSKGIKGIRKALKGANTILPGIQFIQGFEVIIHPSCEHAIEEFNTYTFDQDNDGKWLNKPIDANNHIIDALRYSLEKYHIVRKKRKKNIESKTKVIKSLGL
ncbi:TPA: PBSX family phage terminase large subunit, partial [Staphylococcus aureus]